MTTIGPVSPPAPRDILALSKPVTWFPPMWAFMCGTVSSGVSLIEHPGLLVAGIVLAGPMITGTSQAVNDWFDRDVDAINEPGRPIPSGRIAGRWGLWIAIAGSLLSLVLAAAMGPWVLAAAVLGLLCAWGYSAPPFRFKTSGWLGPAVVGFTYEGLAWFTGAALLLGALPATGTLLVLGLYSIGAFGIMTLNDFKAVKGDRETGLRSLPVVLGERPAALLACAVMALAQAMVIALLAAWGLWLSAGIVGLFTLIQLILMPRLVAAPAARAPWYNATGVSFYVFGMLAAALGLGGYF